MFTEGTLIAGRYRLHHLLGEGGMGQVWSATDERLRRKVAVKLLKKPSLVDTRGGGGELAEGRRLLREARAACAVEHPNVVEVFEVAHQGDMPFLVMELLQGISLRQHLDSRGQLGAEEVCALFVQVVSAVGTAHACGIVHRDLKPANIFLLHSPVGPRHVKVLDFGIAKVVLPEGPADTGHLTRTGERLGTTAYMSPEQVFIEPDLDHRTDIWSLGISMYECLSGNLPTAAGNPGQVIKNITKLPIAPIQTLVPDLPPELGQLVGRMLAKDPAARPADLREVLEVLEKHTPVRSPSFGAPRSVTAVVFDPQEGMVAPLPRSRPSGKPRPGRRVPATLAAALVACLGAAGFGLAWRGTGDTSSPHGSANLPIASASSTEAPAPPRATPADAPISPSAASPSTSPSESSGLAAGKPPPGPTAALSAGPTPPPKLPVAPTAAPGSPLAPTVDPVPTSVPSVAPTSPSTAQPPGATSPPLTAAPLVVPPPPVSPFPRDSSPFKHKPSGSP